ncbi:MAG: hypothetical protein HC805_02885, partial [Alkalinema sp. RL_2_19]|nr:hypothetical protein [Alkalinema sp. RL_2_19]
MTVEYDLVVIGASAAGIAAAKTAAAYHARVALMRRQVDHHLARARAVGRRGIGLSRANAMDSAR